MGYEKNIAETTASKEKLERRWWVTQSNIFNKQDYLRLTCNTLLCKFQAPLKYTTGHRLIKVTKIILPN
jgi:hypothetical protein